MGRPLRKRDSVPKIIIISLFDEAGTPREIAEDVCVAYRYTVMWLARLLKRGLVTRLRIQRGSHQVGACEYYYSLTDLGRKMAIEWGISEDEASKT